MSATTVTTIVTMLAQGRPVWYVAAVTKVHAHEVHTVGMRYGYPSPAKLRQAADCLVTTAAS